MPSKSKVYIAYYLFVKYKPRPDVPPGLVHSSQQPESKFQELSDYPFYTQFVFLIFQVISQINYKQ